jgi:hypothetical protein
MLRSGPIPYFIHGIIEYVAAIAFVLAPFVLGFDSHAATYLSVAVGVIVIVVAATTEGPTSLVNAMPIGFHVLLDYLLALALIALPFLAGFSKEGAPTAWFIALGFIHLLLTIGTRFRAGPDDHERPARRRRSVVGGLAAGTSVDVEAGEHTVLDD